MTERIPPAQATTITVDPKKVAKAMKIICDVLEARDVDIATAAVAFKALSRQLEIDHGIRIDLEVVH